MPDINFLRQRSKELSQLEQRDRLWFRYSLGIMGAVMLLALISVSTRWWFLRSYTDVQDAQARARSAILSQEATERTYLIFVHKLKVLGNILSQHRDKQQAIDFFATVFPADILVEQINYEAKGGILSFIIMAPDVFVMEQAFSTLSQGNVREQYASLTTSRMQRGDDGSYRLQVTVTLNAAEEK